MSEEKDEHWIYAVGDEAKELMSMREKVKSLESRLKEAEDKIAEYHNAYEGKKHRIYELEQRLKEAEKMRCQCEGKYRCPIHECQDALYRQIANLEGLVSQDTSEFKSAAFQKIKSLEQRLEQSEMKNVAAYANCNELNKRLSHLMDVAKKLVAQIDGEGGHGYSVHGLCDKLKSELGR